MIRALLLSINNKNTLGSVAVLPGGVFSVRGAEFRRDDAVRRGDQMSLEKPAQGKSRDEGGGGQGGVEERGVTGGEVDGAGAGGEGGGADVQGEVEQGGG